MTFPLWYLIIPYLVFLAVWLILSLIALYHLLRFGGHKVGSIMLAVIYIAGSIALLTLSYNELMTIGWQNEASVFANRPAMPSFEIPSY